MNRQYQGAAAQQAVGEKNTSSVNIRQNLGLHEEKTAEEKAEEKKKMDMMRQFYRNRHSSFLQGLQE